MIPFIIITLDKPYECRLGYRESLAYQQITGKSLAEIQEVGLDNVAGLLCAMLRKHDQSLTVESVEQLIDEHVDSISALIGLVAACVDAAYNLDKQNPNVKTLAAIKRLPII